MQLYLNKILKLFGVNLTDMSDTKFDCKMHKLLKKGAVHSLTMECISKDLGKYDFILDREFEYFPTIYLNYMKKDREKEEIKIRIYAIGIMLKQFIDNLTFCRHIEIVHENFPESDKLYKEYITGYTIVLLDNKDIIIEQVEEGNFYTTKPIPIIGIEIKEEFIPSEFKYNNKLYLHKDVLDNLRTFLDEVIKLLK